MSTISFLFISLFVIVDSNSLFFSFLKKYENKNVLFYVYYFFFKFFLPIYSKIIFRYTNNKIKTSPSLPNFFLHVTGNSGIFLGPTYAFRVLRAHGLNGPNLWEVSRATAVAKLTYACSAWWGYVDAGAKSRIQSTI